MLGNKRIAHTIHDHLVAGLLLVCMAGIGESAYAQVLATGGIVTIEPVSTSRTINEAGGTYEFEVVFEFLPTNATFFNGTRRVELGFQGGRLLADFSTVLDPRVTPTQDYSVSVDGVEQTLTAVRPTRLGTIYELPFTSIQFSGFMTALPADRRLTRRIVLTAKDDGVDEGPNTTPGMGTETINLVFNPSNPDGGAPLPTPGITYTFFRSPIAILDNDTNPPGVTVTPTTLTTTEGGMATFTVVLDTEPAGYEVRTEPAPIPGPGLSTVPVYELTNEVRVTVTSSDPSGGGLVSSVGTTPAISTVLTFTDDGGATPWDTPQSVTVNGADNLVSGSPVIYDITFNADGGTFTPGSLSRPDNDYDGVTVAAVSVTNEDNDGMHGVIVTETGGGTSVAENGGTDTFTVALSSEPADDVVLTLTSSDINEGTVTPATLTFTPTSGATPWDTPQTVTLTGVNDNVDRDGDSFTVDFAITDGDGANYPITPSAPVVTVTATDDDTVSRNITLAISPTNVAETADNESITITATLGGTVVLGTPINITVTPTGENSFTITIPPLMTSATRRFSITPDADADTNDETINISGTASGFSVAGATLTIRDAGLSVFQNASGGMPISLTIGATEGIAHTFYVRLTRAPTGNVVVVPTSRDPTELTINTPSLTFTTANWNMRQAVEVTGVDDDVFRTDSESVTATDRIHRVDFAVTTGDGNIYPNDLPLASVDVRVTDDDEVTLVLSAFPTDIPEDAGPTTVTVTAMVMGSTRVSRQIVQSVNLQGGSPPVPGTSTQANATLQATGERDATVTSPTTNCGANCQGFGSVTIPPFGDSSGTITFTIDPLTDTRDEGRERLRVQGDGFGYGVDSVTQAEIFIVESGVLAFEALTGGASIDAVTIAEVGSDILYVQLASQPAGDVTLSVTSSDANEGTVNVAALTFTNADWETRKPVTVTAVNDDIDRDDSFTVDFVITATGDTGNYPTNLSIPSVTVTVTDDDAVGIALFEESTSGAGSTAVTIITTSETAGTGNVATFYVELTSQPTGPVTVTIDGIIATEHTLTAPASGTLTFTPTGGTAWNTRQAITLTGVDDDFVDDDQMYNLTLTPTGGGYDSVTPAIVPITNTDDDTAGLTIADLMVDEDAGTATVTVTLTPAVTAGTVTVDAATMDGTATTAGTDYTAITSQTLTFVAGNTSQTLDIPINDDSIAEGNENFTVVLSNLMPPTGITTVSIADATATVTIIDDDVAVAGLALFEEVDSATGSTVVTSITTSEPDVADTFYVELTSAPTNNVTVAVTSDDTSEGTVSPATLTFTTGNWNIRQLVTVTGANDDLVDGPQNYNVILNPASTDTNYNALADTTVTATNTDDDTAALALFEEVDSATGSTVVTSITTSEPDVADTFYVELTSAPTNNVTVAVTSDDTSEGTVSPATLTFTTGNWNIRQLVTVTGANDDLVDGPQNYNVILNPASTDTNYNALADTTVTATNADDDVAAAALALFEEVDSATGSTVVTSITTSEPDVADTFYVELTSAPTNNVTVAVTSDDTSEGTVSPATLTFTTGNWNIRQLVTVTGANDDLVDGPQNYNVILNPASTDTNYNALADTTVTATNTDDDTAALALFEEVDSATGSTVVTSITTSEPDVADTFYVELTSAPTNNVTVAVTSDDTSEGTVSPATLTFTTGNWNIRQLVTVTGANDDLVDGPQNYNVILNPASTDTNYNALADTTVTATNTDDDTAALALFEEVDSATGSTVVTSITTSEPDVADTFYVELTSAPTNNVTVAVTSDDTSEGTVSPATLTFTTGNWNIRQLVTVTGANDDLVDGPQNYNVILNPASTDTNYNALADTTVTATNTDDDTAALALFEEVDSATGSTVVTSITTSEPDVADTFYVELTSAPTNNVTVAVTSDDTGEGTVSPATLTFTTGNWNIRQLVTVTGANDDLVDGPQNYNVILNPASTDTNYNALADTTVTATNTDDDVAPAAALALFEEVDSATGSTVVTSITTSEPDVADTFYVELTSAPTNNVTVAVTSDDTSEGTVSPATLTFTTGNWNIRQLVTVTGANDDLVDGPQNYNVILNPASTDTNYNALADTTVTATNTDDDTAALALFEEVDSATGSTVVTSITTSEPDVADTFYVELTSAPTNNVTVAVTSDDTSEGTVSPATLTFTTGNWNIRQLVTVTGANDDLVDGPQNYNVILNPASTDTNYNALADTTVTATNTDDDTAALALFEEVDSATGSTVVTSITTSEPDVADTFYVELTSAPTNNVTVAVTSDDTSEGTVSPATLTFTTGNWNIRQLVTVTGANDDLVDGPQNYNVILNPASTDTNYNALADTTVTATNTDDDTAALALFEEVDSATGSTVVTSITTSEPDVADTFYVELTSAPTNNVTVAVTSDDTSEGTVSPATLTFTTGNWNIRQLVTVTGANDDLVDGPQNYNVILNPASTDTNYNALADTTVTATNTDDDTAEISIADLSVDENAGTATLTVTLTSAVTAGDVMVELTTMDGTATSTDYTAITSQTLTFTAGSTSETLSITINDDSIAEGNEAFTVTLDNLMLPAAVTGDVSITGATATVTITDDDTLSDTINLSVSPLTVAETADATTITVTATIDGTAVSPTDTTVTVSVGESGDSAVEGTDYATVADFTLTIPALSSSGMATFMIDPNTSSTNGDIVTISGTAGGFTTINSATLTIVEAGISVHDAMSAGNPISTVTIAEASGTDMLYVQLVSQPAGNVTLSVTSDDTNEGMVTPATLTFTTTNWNTRQPVTVTAVPDNVDRDDTFTVDFAVTTGSGAYNPVTLTTLPSTTVTVTDDDTAGIALFEEVDSATGSTVVTSIATTEAGGTDTFYVELTSAPTANVTVAVTSDDTGEGTVSPATLTFTTGNWNIRQLVTATGQDDSDVDGDQTYTVTLNPASTDPAYNALTDTTVTATNTDDDVAPAAALALFEEVNSATGSTVVTSIATTEAGGTDTFYVELTSAPTANVTVAVTSDDTGEGTVSPATLTFTTGNWNIRQLVTATGQDDSDVDGDQTYTVTLNPASTDPAYNALTDTTVTATNTDDDVAPAAALALFEEVNSATGSTVVTSIATTEAGGTDTFYVELTSAPTANVTVAVTSDDTGEGTVSPATLTFTTGNWNIRQLVTATGQDDSDVDGDQTYTVTLNPASTDPAYNALTDTTVTATNTDDDVAPAAALALFEEVNSATGSTVVTSIATTEAGGTDTFYVELTSAPTANVTVAVTSDDTGEGTVSPATLTFTTGNWNIRQLVTATGQDDSDVDGDQTYTVTLNPASTDPAYNALTDTTVTATNTDDDVAPAAALALFEEVNSATGSTVVTSIATTEAGGTDTFYVELTSAPTANVTVAVTSDDTGEGTVSPATLTFTTGNWNIRQLVTATGQDDSDVDGDQTYTVTLNPASTDPAYNALTDTTVTATNTDDDVAPAAALALFEEVNSATGSTVVTSIATTEAGGTDTFYVELTSAPTANVTVAVTSDDTGEGTVSPATLTFTTGNWNIRQLVTATGQDDSDVDGDQTYTVTLNPASTDPAYNALTDTTVTATNTDDDVAPAAALALFEEVNSATGSTVVTSIATTEAGGTDTFYVELTSAPTANVTVAVTSDDTGEGTVSPATLTFTTGNWNIRQLVTATGQDDSDVDGDQTYTVTLNPASTDPAYNALTDTTVTATNTDIEGLNTQQREALHGQLLGVANQATMQAIVDVLSKRLQPRARTEAHGSVAGHVLGLQEGQAVDWQKRLSLVVYSTLQRLDDGGALLVPVDATTFNNSEFALPLEVGESVVVLWGALGSSTVEGGQSDASDYDGDLIAVLLGIDSMIGEHARLGIAASYEHSELDYQLDMTSGDAVQKMTSIQPYLSWQPYDSVGLWLLGGYGFGDYDATESTAGGTTLRAEDADVERWMAALGFHYTHRFGSSGWDMVLNNKALWNRTVRDATRFDDGSLLPKNISANWRARLESEVGYSWTFGDGSVRPYGLASVRWDGGDVVNDDTTFMVDAGGGVELSFASRLSMDFKVRRQVTDGDHEENNVVAVGSFGFAEHADGQGWQVALERSLLGGLSAPEHNKAGFDFEQGDSTPTIGQSPSLQANVGYGRLINPLNDAEAGLLKTYTRFYLDPDENKRHAVGLGFDFASLQVGVESEYNNGELETLLRGHIDF